MIEYSNLCFLLTELVNREKLYWPGWAELVEAGPSQFCCIFGVFNIDGCGGGVHSDNRSIRCQLSFNPDECL